MEPAMDVRDCREWSASLKTRWGAWPACTVARRTVQRIDGITSIDTSAPQAAHRSIICGVLEYCITSWHWIDGAFVMQCLLGSGG